MLNNLEEWIANLREEDKNNTRDFLTTTCDYLNKNKDFLIGSGFYIVGSSLTGKTCIAKKDVIKKEESMTEELFEGIKTQFGEQRAKRYAEFMPDKEIEEFIREGFDRIREEAPKRARGEYGDIDCVIAGLNYAKLDLNLNIWKEYVQLLKDRFPQAQHPDKFSDWCIGGYLPSYQVRDYTLNIPTPTRPTAIHFMLYEGDMRKSAWCYRKERTLARWKQQQAEDKLDFLVISEF